MRVSLLIITSAMLTGCVSTAGKIITAPVKVVSKGADWATTSQDESDRNRGRQIRKQEERERKEQRRRERKERDQR